MSIHNERGVIAENYYELQALHVIDRAREANPLPAGSGESVLRAVFQSAEVALLNLADLFARATRDVEATSLSNAVVKLSWVHGFTRVLTRVSMIPHQLGFVAGDDGQQGVLRISDSPAFGELVAALRGFDQTVIKLVEAGGLDPQSAIAAASVDNVQFRLLHLARICAHESTTWERNLGEIRVPAPVSCYEAFVLSSEMRDAVYDRVLEGDTYFTQFRGLHQIPEILSTELCDRLAEAIRAIRSKHLPEAIDHVDCCNVLSEAILAAMPAMVDSLATSDYHEIRENLGLTSGSHSVVLHFEMFRDLYEQLAKAVAQHLVEQTGLSGSNGQLQGAIREANRTRYQNADAWAADRLVTECLKFRAFVEQWRALHLHLPRNNLGGGLTKSLTGSPDAVSAVRQMRDSARARDAFTPFAAARHLPTADAKNGHTPLADHIESESSLDSLILTVTGGITKRRFERVQERLGFFANKCPFAHPPRREV